MTDIEERLRELARDIGGPSESASAAARDRVEAVVAGLAGGPEPAGAARRPRRRIGRRRGLLVLAGAVVVGGASAVAISSLGHSGAAAPAACQVFADRGAGPQRLNFYAPATGVSDSGAAIVAWVARGGSVQAVSRVDDGNWGAPRSVSPQLSTQILPRSVSLTMGAEGDGVLGWTSKEAQVVGWTPESGWGTARTLTVPGFRTAPYEPPGLAMNAAGDAVALWAVAHRVRYLSGGSASIADPFPVLARRAPDGTWQVVAELDHARGMGPRFPGGGRRAGWGFAPSLALGDDGTTTLVGAGSFPGIAYERLSATGGRLVGGAVDAGQGYNADAIAIDADGDVTAVWMRGTNLVGGVLSARTGVWTTRVVANAGLYSTEFSLAANRAGDAVLVFRGRARGVRGPRFPSRAPTARRDRDVQVVSYDAVSRRWTRAIRVSAIGEPAMSPRAAIDSSGRATVAWVEGSNNGRGLTRLMVAESSAAGWSPARSVSAATKDPIAPALAVASGGRALVAWTGCRGAGAAAYVSERSEIAWSEPKLVG